MRIETEVEFSERRERQQRAMALAASKPRVRAIHTRLADAHAERARSIAERAFLRRA